MSGEHKGWDITMLRKIGWILIFGFGTACASTTPGARPHDMSAARHESESHAHARTAEVHAAQYDPVITVERTRCLSQGAGTGTGNELCWTSISNPTEGHLRAAEAHRRHAANHRAASLALREAEAQACAGIAPGDRDMSPFEHIEDIATIDPFVEPLRNSNGISQRTAGVIITFRAIPGMTAEWLQKIVDCHIARNASLGHSVPEMPNCPLVPNGVEAQVSSTSGGFTVSIRSGRDDIAREILSRAEQLRTTPH